MERLSLLGSTQSEYSAQVASLLGKGRQHAALVYEAFFRTGAPPAGHPAFQNAPRLLEDILAVTELPDPVTTGVRSDGATGKFLLKIDAVLEVEAVLIPMQSGGTLCISSQVGCRMGCVFCETGRMGLLKSLSASEIVSQVYAARHLLGYRFRNIVFMGMGEPFDNYEAVLQAARILMDPKGFGFGRKNVTISTSGCADAIRRFTREGGQTPNLAVSINAPDDKSRTRLMPVNRKHNMADLHAAMEEYCRVTGRQILTAYVLLQGINDTLEHADQLAGYLRGLDVKVNLIPYNPQSCDRFQPPDLPVLEAFARRMRDHGYYTLLRLTKGRGIMAACGQLGNLELRKQRKVTACGFKGTGV